MRDGRTSEESHLRCEYGEKSLMPLRGIDFLRNDNLLAPDICGRSTFVYLGQLPGRAFGGLSTHVKFFIKHSDDVLSSDTGVGRMPLADELGRMAES